MSESETIVHHPVFEGRKAGQFCYDHQDDVEGAEGEEVYGVRCTVYGVRCTVYGVQESSDGEEDSKDESLAVEPLRVMRCVGFEQDPCDGHEGEEEN